MLLIKGLPAGRRDKSEISAKRFTKFTTTPPQENSKISLQKSHLPETHLKADSRGQEEFKSDKH
jgi:hypothetical protein